MRSPFHTHTRWLRCVDSVDPVETLLYVILEASPKPKPFKPSHSKLLCREGASSARISMKGPALQGPELC